MNFLEQIQQSLPSIFLLAALVVVIHHIIFRFIRIRRMQANLADLESKPERVNRLTAMEFLFMSCWVTGLVALFGYKLPALSCDLFIACAIIFVMRLFCPRNEHHE